MNFRSHRFRETFQLIALNVNNHQHRNCTSTRTLALSDSPVAATDVSAPAEDIKGGFDARAGAHGRRRLFRERSVNRPGSSSASGDSTELQPVPPAIPQLDQLVS